MGCAAAEHYAGILGNPGLTSQMTEHHLGNRGLGLFCCCREDFHVPWAALFPCPSSTSEGLWYKSLPWCISTTFLRPAPNQTSPSPPQPPWHPLKHHSAQDRNPGLGCITLFWGELSEEPFESCSPLKQADMDKALEEGRDYFNDLTSCRALLHNKRLTGTLEKPLPGNTSAQQPAWWEFADSS